MAIKNWKDELPDRPSRVIDSESIIQELKENSPKWGQFYEQADEKKGTAGGRINIVKNYAKRNGLPVEVISKTEEGKLQGWGRWLNNKEDPNDDVPDAGATD